MEAEKLKRKPKTQAEMVLFHLQEVGQITDLDAFKDYAIRRLAAVIYNLRADGWEIETHHETGKNRFGRATKWARYTLKQESQLRLI